MRILVVGAGATGGFFGARLADAGRDVTFLVRPARARVLAGRGLRVLTSPDGRVENATAALHVRPRVVTSAELHEGYDVVLVSVKARALDAVLDDVAAAVGEDTRIVPFLNGMAHLEKLNGRFGAHRVLGGVVKVVATLTDSGDVLQVPPLAGVGIGEQRPFDPGRLQQVRAALEGAGFEVSSPPDVVAAMWHKWVFIAAAGALTCLMRANVGDIVAAPGGEQVAGAVLAETWAVAAAAGHPVPERERRWATRMLTTPGSSFTSSLYRDVVSGAPSEAEHLLGDMTARARALGVPTPVLDLATVQLRVHETRLARAGTTAAGPSA